MQDCVNFSVYMIYIYVCVYLQAAEEEEYIQFLKGHKQKEDLKKDKDIAKELVSNQVCFKFFCVAFCPAPFTLH